MALLLLLNINLIGFSNDKFKTNIIKYENDSFYGNININGNKHPLIVQIKENSSYKKEEIINDKTENKSENVNKKEEKVNKKVNDDETPGKIFIKIPTKDGELIYNNDMGSSEKSEFDQECLKNISDSLVRYIDSLTEQNNSIIPKKVKNTVKGFANYCKKDTAKKGFIRKMFSWL